jgi:hypothetical protein
LGTGTGVFGISGTGGTVTFKLSDKPTGFPQALQNLTPSRFSFPQLAHAFDGFDAAAIGLPQLEQNFIPSRFALPHFTQTDIAVVSLAQPGRALQRTNA